MLNFNIKIDRHYVPYEKKFGAVCETSGFKLHVSETEGKKKQQEPIFFKLHMSGRKSSKNLPQNISFALAFNRSKEDKR